MSSDASERVLHARRSRNATAVTKAAEPTKNYFDPWNSSATGHQRAQNRLSGSTSWRDSRNYKLAAQFQSGQSGGARLHDTVGAGSEHFGEDGRKQNGGWERGASGLRGKGQRSILEAMNLKSTKAGIEANELSSKEEIAWPAKGTEGLDRAEPATQDAETLRLFAQEAGEPPNNGVTERRIFDNLVFYINGSTAPFISDHKLKHLLAEHGARLSIALGRRSVTHVILGTGCGQGGAGGGLAGSKIQKEITRIGGKGVKFVGPEWFVLIIV
jgi:hypothetical protein